jgi:MFS family permease
MMFGASPPSPLHAVHAQRFGVSATTLNAIFAVSALIVVLTLSPAGMLSDQLGRRPVSSGPTAVQAATMILFLLADGASMLYAARIVLGVATGGVLGTLNAALVDLQPAGTAGAPRLPASRKHSPSRSEPSGRARWCSLALAPLRLVLQTQVLRHGRFLRFIVGFQ